LKIELANLYCPSCGELMEARLEERNGKQFRVYRCLNGCNIEIEVELLALRTP